MADKIDVMNTDGPTLAAMLGLPGDWVAERQPRIADLWTWSVVGAIGDKVHAYRMSITGKEVLAHGDHELRDLFHARMIELRTKLLEAGAELGAHKLFPPAPHAACDLCGCAVAAAWFRWDDPNARCYGLACACGECHDKVRNVGERLLGAARRLSLGAVTELARRLEEGPPAPPRDQGHGAPRMDVGAVLGAVPLTRAGRTQEDTERNLGKLIAERGALQAQLRDVACALEPTGVPGHLSLVGAARWVADQLQRRSHRDAPHPGAPTQCPGCEWSNGLLLNYGTPGVPLWLCHGCAARRIRGEVSGYERAFQEMRGVYNLMGAVARADVDQAKRIKAADELDDALARAEAERAAPPAQSETKGAKPPAPPSLTWCPQCGDGVSVDEDGCCVSCGSTATGEGADQASAARLAAGMVAARLGCEVDGPTMLRHIERVVRDGQRKDRTIGELMNRLAEVQGHSSIDLDGPKRSSEVADRTLRGAPAECHTPDACEAADACKAQDAVCVEDAAWQRWRVTRHGEERFAIIPADRGKVGHAISLTWPTKNGDGEAEAWVMVEPAGPRLTRRPMAIRGEDYPCEDCGKRQGATRDNRGFMRCKACGYPGQ